MQAEICVDPCVVDLENSIGAHSVREPIDGGDSVELAPPLYTSIRIPVVSSGSVLVSNDTKLPASLDTSVRVPEVTPEFVLISDVSWCSCCFYSNFCLSPFIMQSLNCFIKG